jgi:hypothetical protein
VEFGQLLDTLSACIMSDDVVAGGMSSAMQRELNMSKRQQERGLTVRHTWGLESDKPSSHPQLRQSMMPHSYGPKALKDLDFVYDWFHNECPIVDIDKSRKFEYTKKVIFCAGKSRWLDCQVGEVGGTGRG